MKGLPSEILEAIRATFTSLSHLVIENIALRQQLAVLKVARPQPKLTPFDRVFWVFLSRIWPHWSDPLILVMPETVVRSLVSVACITDTNGDKRPERRPPLIRKRNDPRQVTGGKVRLDLRVRPSIFGETSDSSSLFFR